MKGTIVMRTRSSALAMACLPLLLGSVPAHAAWEIVPDLTTFADNDDNVLLAEDEAEQVSASRILLDAAVRLANFGPRGNVYVEPRYVTDAYSGEENKQFERDDFFFESGGTYQWTSASAGFLTRYANQLILSSEFAEISDDPDGGFGDPDTGRLEFFDEKQERFDLRADFGFDVSERNRIRFDVVRQDVAYTGQQNPRRTDFDWTGFYLSIVRNIDERNRVTARALVTDYYAVRNDNTSLSAGVEGVFTRSLGATWSLDISAGVQRTEYDYLRLTVPIEVREENATTNPTYGVTFRKTGERSRWSASLRHIVQANANGFVVVRDDFNTVFERQLTQRLSGRIGARLNQTNAVDELRQIDDRDYARIELGIEWAIQPTLFLIGGMDLISQDFVNDPDPSAQSNSFYLGLTYRGRSRQN